MWSYPSETNFINAVQKCSSNCGSGKGGTKSMFSYNNFKQRRLMILLIFVLLIPYLIQSGQPSVIGQSLLRRLVEKGNGEMGLQFRLSEGQEESKQQEPPNKVAAAEPLDPAAIDNLLKRLPPIKAEADDEQDFAFRDRSLPPPRTGQTISGTFPPAGSATAPETAKGPLEVVRFAPEGEVPLAPHLSITFSQPMVAVTSNDDLSAGQVPVKLTPQPAGKWRWLGTKTLLFDPAGRMPMATEYLVEIPAGTKSAIGGTLANTKRWTFSTSQPKVTTSYPNSGLHKRNPLFFLAFDQRIDPDEALGHIRLSGGARDWKLRLVTAEELTADETISRLAKQNETGRWVAFRIATSESNPLPGSTNFTMTVDPGMPSAEGPRKTIEPQSFSFSTYGPLFLKNSRCGYDNRCEPGFPINLEFNNPLEQRSFDQNKIRVVPDIPGKRVYAYEQWINIEGATKGGVTYQVTIDASLKDVFDQTLGESRTLTFKVGPAPPALVASTDLMAVVDPFGAPRFSVYTVNHQQIKVTLYSVTTEDWYRYVSFIQARWQGGAPEQAIPDLTFGRRVSSEIVKVATRQDELIETAIDLKPALNNGVGHVIAVVEAVQPAKRPGERRSVIAWPQVTAIGLDAFADYREVLGWATSLKDGKPLPDVELTLTSETRKGTATGKTDADGLAHIEMQGEPMSHQEAPYRARDVSSLLIARKGNDTAFLPPNISYWMYDKSGWFKKRPYGDLLKWHVFDDRGMYRPGEEVKIKGWVRRLGAGPLGDVMASEVNNLTYRLLDSRGNELLTGSASVNALGGFDTAFKLPPTMNLGYGNLELKATGVSQDRGPINYHQIRVQEFRRPEYEVKASTTPGPHFVRSHSIMTVAANYYAGGALQNTE